MGYHSAAPLLIAAGDNPDRIVSEAAFATLCAAAPVPVSSGRSHHHRLNHGGHRQANRALHTIAVSRIRGPDQRTRDYVTRRNPNDEFKADLDTLRRLKRYIAREVYPLVIDALSTPPKTPLQPLGIHRNFGSTPSQATPHHLELVTPISGVRTTDSGSAADRSHARGRPAGP